ncbi:hypothetical protein [Legionella feeleii]|nr:hypothetical protein [Legionella feeleii]
MKVEPQACYLDVPVSGDLLYKMMSVENFVQSVEKRYIHFQRVNAYSDFPGADPHAGAFHD